MLNLPGSRHFVVMLRLLDKPAARALLHSLLQYVRLDEFEPREELEFALLDKLV